MGIYYSKQNLYREISQFKEFLGLKKNSYGFDLVELCLDHGITIEFLPFKTKGLRGMVVFGKNEHEDAILLNSNRSKREQNFDCGHETIHLGFHRKAGLQTLNCFDKIKDTQNPFLEWHANEGAAELFIPYKVLLPLIKERIRDSSDYSVIESAKLDMANIFEMPEAVIKYRIENLKYEIHQYLNGVSLDNIEILSLTQQERRNIKINSLNTISDNDFNAKCQMWHDNMVIY